MKDILINELQNVIDDIEVFSTMYVTQNELSIQEKLNSIEDEKKILNKIIAIQDILKNNNV